MSVLFAALLIVALVLGWRRAKKKPAAAYMVVPARVRYAHRPDAPEQPGRWLLAANAIHSLWLERPVDELLDLPGRPSYNYALEQQWEVKTRDDLLFQLAHLYHRGDRRAIRALQQADPALPPHDTHAYDLGRFLHLCVAGASVGLITPANAQVLMLHAGRALQKKYSGWPEYADAFLAGHLLNRVNKGLAETPTFQARLATLRQIIRVLNSDRTSPWRELDWATPLPRPEPDDYFDRSLRNHFNGAVIYIDEDAFVPSDAHWAMAAGAIYRAWWGQPIDLLVCDDGERHSGLKRDWGIASREDALGVLMWLQHEGHRGALRDLQATVPAAPGADPLAWDLVRHIQVSMGVATAGYLRPEEALNLMHHAALALQRGYGSWTEMRAGFEAGRQLWRRYRGHGRSDELRREDASMTETLDLLDHDDASPWRKLPWNGALSAPLPDDFFALVSGAYLSGQAAGAGQIGEAEVRQLN